MSQTELDKKAEELKKRIAEINDDKDLTTAQKTKRVQIANDLYNAEVEADKENDTRSGVGTRVMVGSTRGKNTSVIKYEAFDESKPDTMPKSVEDFTKFVKPTSQEMLDFLVVGYNEASYKSASDEIGEFINPVWSKDVQNTFRVVVRGYAKNAGVSIEQAVAIIKPGIEAAHAAKAIV